MNDRHEFKPSSETKTDPVTRADGLRWTKLAGVGACVIALGAIAAMMALPKSRGVLHVLSGPFVARLSKDDIQVNLAGESSKRYLSMSLNAEYFAYDEDYVAKRIGVDAAKDARGENPPDPLYVAMLQDAVLDIAATRTRDQVTDPVQIEAFLEDIRRAVDPLLFPVCVGDSLSRNSADSRSGLRAGESIMQSTMRGLLDEHRLQIDAARRILRLDDGTNVSFQGKERDLAVENERRERVYIDVTTLEPDFEGEIRCGVAGKVQRIYRERFLVQ